VQTCIHCQSQLEAQGKFKKHVMTSKTTYKTGGEIEEIEDTIVRAQ
jgi:hypothetical protein